MQRHARAAAAVGLVALAATTATSTSAAATTAAADPVPAATARATSIASAHPSLRALPTPVRTLTAGGANASEVHAVADLVESIAPEARVRSVTKKGASFIVRAVADGRTQVYRVPASMVQAAPQPGDAA